MTDQIQAKDFSAELDLIFAGKKVVPNFVEIPLSDGVANIASAANLCDAGAAKNAKLPNGKSSWGHWARYFFTTTQGGAIDGQGYVIWYDHGKGKVARFAICEHKKVVGHGANPRRGWHPGRCGKCGLNMTVDSGD